MKQLVIQKIQLKISKISLKSLCSKVDLSDDEENGRVQDEKKKQAEKSFLGAQNTMESSRLKYFHMHNQI